MAWREFFSSRLEGVKGGEGVGGGEDVDRQQTELGACKRFAKRFRKAVPAAPGR
jgi:hypothetical protein